MWKLGLRPPIPRKGIHKWDFRCSVVFYPFMTLITEAEGYRGLAMIGGFGGDGRFGRYGHCDGSLEGHALPEKVCSAASIVNCNCMLVYRYTSFVLKQTSPPKSRMSCGSNTLVYPCGFSSCDITLNMYCMPARKSRFYHKRKFACLIRLGEHTLFAQHERKVHSFSNP
jgi:hypothetical protein